MSNFKSIYLDHSATTPVDKAVLRAMTPYFNGKFGNGSSLHAFGQEAMAAVDKAREQVARHLHCQAEEVIFTSGATEADNLAILGVIKALKNQGGKDLHIITTAVEHPAVLEPCRALMKDGVRVTFLPVKDNGVVDINEFKKSVSANTALVSIMYVNSEVGCIQPIREIGKIIEKINQDRLKSWQSQDVKQRQTKPQLIYFHTDAVQAVNFLSCDAKFLHVDLLSLSGHKIYGPKGIGALFVKSGTPIAGVQLGGHQEKNLRSGTLNIPGIVGLAAALDILAKRQKKDNETIGKLRNKLIQGLTKSIPRTVVNTDLAAATPAHAHFSFIGAEGESVLIALDLAGVAVSTGSACASGSLKPSHVLLAMGIKQEVAHNSIRFTLGRGTTPKEINGVIKILPPIIARLRKMSPAL